jgi:hypothetical protein
VTGQQLSGKGDGGPKAASMGGENGCGGPTTIERCQYHNHHPTYRQTTTIQHPSTLSSTQRVAEMGTEGQQQTNDASTTTTTLHYRQATTIQHPSTLSSTQRVAGMGVEGQRRMNDASTTTTTLHYRQTTTIQHPSTLSSTQQVAGMGTEGQRRTNDASTTTTTLHYQQMTTTQHPHQLCEQLLAGWFEGANGEHNDETQHDTTRTMQGQRL